MITDKNDKKKLKQRRKEKKLHKWNEFLAQNLMHRYVYHV